MSDPIQNALQPEAPLPRHSNRPRPYAPPQPAIPPDYARFCEVHTRHRALWQLTYAPDQPAPYRGHHRQVDGITLAAADLDALDFALGAFAAPPQRTRPYLGHPVSRGPSDDLAPAAPRRRAGSVARLLDLGDARTLHQMADDLISSTQEHTYWTAAVRDAALEILSRVADLLGDTCGLRGPDSGSSSACVRPLEHEGGHLDASGNTWHNIEGEVR